MRETRHEAVGDVEEISTRLAARFGPSVATWCAGVPALAGRLAAELGLTLGAVIPDGASSVVFHCTRADGAPAILKLSPDNDFLAEQAAMLRLLAASGRVPELLAVDPSGLLVEAVTPGTCTDELPVPPSARDWAELLTDLHGVPAVRGPVRELRDRAEEFFARIGRRLAEPAIAARISGMLWQRAMSRCESLLDSDENPVLLHGDLHLGNVLDGGPRGLVAIDPKVCRGDRCFDAVDYVLAGAGLDSVTTRCDAVAAFAGLDPDRLHTWAQVCAPLTAIAHLTWGGPEAAVTELLALAA